MPQARRLLLGAEEDSGPDASDDQQDEQEHHYSGYEDYDYSLTRCGIVNFPYPYYGQIDTVQASYPTDYGYPADERGHRRIGTHPERTLEARVARAYDQHDEQVQYSGPDEQANGGTDRGKDYADKERAEPLGVAHANTHQTEQATEDRRNFVTDDREDQRVHEVALAPDAAEKVGGRGYDAPNRVDEALDR